MWVRSYWQVEHILWNGPKSCFGTSIYPGEITLEHVNDRVLMPMGWSRVVFPVSGEDATDGDEPKTTFGFACYTDDDSIIAYIPFWFLTLTCIVSTWFGIAPPPIIKRFSLHTLLIATTLVAIVLGLIVWSVR
jgi:hypothetical protein